MAEQMNRQDLIVALVAALRMRPGLTGVEIDSGDPGEELKREHIWVGAVEGEITYPTMKSGRRERDIEFDMPLAFHVAIHASFDDTRRRLGALQSEVESYFADDSQLAGLDGIVSAEATRDADHVSRTREGAVAASGLMVHVHARLT